MIKAVILFNLILIVNLAYSITIDGNTYLENQTDHSEIEILFNRLAPTSLTITVYTDVNGFYTAEIETGLYEIVFTKNGYFNTILSAQSLYSNSTLSVITMLEHTTLINVPSIYSTIQRALNVAYDNDTVYVASGIYYENIMWPNTYGIKLIGCDENTCIIDGNQEASVFRFEEEISGINSSTVIANLSITNGYASGSSSDDQGGGIYLHGCSPKLKNLKIFDNSSDEDGGGIYCGDDSNPDITNVLITGNSTEEGGGIYLHSSSPNLTNVIIMGNSASAYGGGIYIIHSSPNLTNVTITENYTSINGGGIFLHNSSPILLNSIVSDNIGNYGIFVSSGNPSITYSDFWNNENGNFYNCDEYIGVNLTTNSNVDSCDAYFNIQLDPCFVYPENGDYHLTEYSPCIDAGDSNSPLDQDGTIADIGAFYYDQSGIIYPPLADFLADIYEGYAPLTINFTDLSTEGTGIIGQWYWNFGNGGNSSNQNPICEYLNSGIYSVTLTVTDENDSTDTATKINYITVWGNAPPAPPTNVQVDIIQPDAVLSWTEVDTTIYGDPIEPDGYILSYSENEDDYFYLWFTTNTEFTHEFVAQYSSQMFYKVIAIINLSREDIEYLEKLNILEEKLRWSDVKHNIYEISK